MQGAARVGLFVVGFIALIFGAYAVLGRTLGGPKPVEFTARFPNAGGIAAGAAVQLAGVKIGVVDRVELVPEGGVPTARVVMAIDPGVAIPAGSQAVVPQSLIGFGSNPVQIVPPPTPSGNLQPAGEPLVGRLASPLEAALPEFKPTLENLNKTLVKTQELLGDQQLKKQLGDLLVSSKQTADRFGRLAASLDATLLANRPNIDKAARDAQGAMAAIRETTERVAKLAASGKLEKEATALLQELNAAAKRGSQLMASLDGFVNDPDLRRNLTQTTENVASITDSGTRIAQNAEKISANGVVLSERAIELSNQASTLVEDVNTVVRRVDRLFSRVPGGTRLPKISTDMSLTRSQDPGRWRTDLNVRAQLGDTALHLGMFDAFETNKVNLQLGRPLGAGELRYGVYASKPGVGVDFPLATRLGLRADLFDINRPRFDLRARYEFGDGVYGWFGVDRVFEKNVPAIGIGIRR